MTDAKMAISHDFLLDQSSASRALNLIAEEFRTAPLYTLAHRPGAVLGPIEQRQIKSSFLSRICVDQENIWKMSFAVPSASKSLNVPCSVNGLICFSRGLGHGIKTCCNTEKLVYVYEDLFLFRKAKTLGEKFFRRSLISWATKNLKNSKEVWASSPFLAQSIEEATGLEVKVVWPPFDVDDYRPLPKGILKSLPNGHFCIDSESVDLDQAKVLIDQLTKLNINYYFLGGDDHLESLKKSREEKFLGKKCAGESAPIIGSCRGVISWQHRGFPEIGIAGLAMHRPVFTSSKDNRFDYFGPVGIFKVENFDVIWDFDEQTLSQNEIDRLSKHLQNFNPIKFKSAFRNWSRKLQ